MRLGRTLGEAGEAAEGPFRPRQPSRAAPRLYLRADPELHHPRVPRPPPPRDQPHTRDEPDRQDPRIEQTE